MPHILVTNDDGFESPGLLALVKALRSLGDVTVFAPDRNWSIAGHAKTLHKPLRVWQTKLADDSDALVTNGTPSDCVGLAHLGLIERSIDIVLSGVNTSANMGYDVTYSGTVAAAMEAAISGYPGIAVSLENGGEEKRYWSTAATAARVLMARVLEHGLPRNTLLNINVPNLPITGLKGYRATRLGQRIYRDVLVTRLDPRGKPYYWIGGDRPTGVEEDGTDVAAVKHGFVSVTPLHMDMTQHRYLQTVQSWLQDLQHP